VHVRRIRADDVRSYREMRLRALTLAPDAYGTTLQAALDREYDDWEGMVLRAATAVDFALFVLDRGGGVLAGSGAAFVGQAPEAEVIQMWLDEDLRGQGWAERLIDAAEGHLAAEGYEVCALWVAEANARARRFYERCGYALTGEAETNGRGIREMRMRKRLAADGERPSG